MRALLRMNLFSKAFAFSLIAIASINSVKSQNNSAKSSGLISYWTFDGDNVNDTWGSNHGTIVGSNISFTTGKVGQALSIGGSGTDSYVAIPSINTPYITVEAWINSTKYGYYTSFVTKKYDISGWNSPYAIWQLWLAEDTNYPGVFGMNYATSATSSETVNMNEWFHIAFTFDGVNTILYINGVQKAISNNNYGSLPSTDGGVYLGYTPDCNHSFTGMIDEVAIWDNALTAAEIQQHYQNSVNGLSYTESGLVASYPFNGNANDESGNGYNGAVYNDVTISTDRFNNANSAYSFDGIDDYIGLPTPTDFLNTSVSQFSFSGWIYCTSGDGTTPQNLFEASTATSATNNEVYFETNMPGTMRFGITSDANADYQCESKPLKLNKWYHVVGTYDGTEQKLYINGILESTQAWSNTFSINSGIEIGKDMQGGQQFNGKIDDIRIYNKALTATEISELYVNYNPPQTLTAIPGDGQVTLKWSSERISEISQYLIYQDGVYIGVLPVSTANDTVYTVTGLTNHQNYEFYVQSTDIYSNTSQPSYTVLKAPSATTVADIDDNVYPTVTIGTQEWMAENLTVTHYQNGEAIPEVTDNAAWSGLTTGAYSNYNNDILNVNIYGRLYNFYSVADSRNLCPTGWHAPSDGEFKTLEIFLGMTQIEADATGLRGTNQGSKVAGNASLWIDGALENDVEFETSGFSALPTGGRNSEGSWNAIGAAAYWWSMSESDASYAWDRSLDYSVTTVARGNDVKNNGFSVRCLKDILSTVIAYYPFNGNANDESGNGNNGTEYNSAAHTTDRFGNVDASFLADGVSSYFTTPINQTQLGSTYSISFWANIENTSNFSYFVFYNNDNENSYKVHLVGVSGSLYLQMADVGDASTTTFNLPTPGFNAWENITLTYDNGLWKYYVNGTLSTQFSKTISNLSFSKIYWCTHEPITSSDYWLKGGMDDIRIYNKVLSSSEISQLYANYNGPETLVAIPGDGQVTLKWSSERISETSQYNIYQDGVNVGTVNVSTANDTVYTVTGLTNYQNYQFYITSTDIYSNVSQPSDTITSQPGEVVTDYDGNTYSTIKIGNQYWLDQNLKVTHYQNGEAIPEVTDNTAWTGLTTSAYCWYNNDYSTYGSIYGALYNWYAVDDSRNLCPTGWHVPTDAEWYTMENYIDPTINDPNAIDWRGTDGGSKLKAISGWASNENSSNIFSFSALPGGYRYWDIGTFFALGTNGTWWTSAESDATYAWYRGINYDDNRVHRYSNPKQFGFSVRCLKDLAAPTITSFAPTSGPVGTSVTITGTNFNSTISNNIVRFGAVKATVTAATSTELIVTVPAGATYQPITVTDITLGLTAYSSSPFNVTCTSSQTIDASSFASAVSFTAGTNPWIVAMGDLDGDGKSDLVVTNNSSSTISVYRNISTLGSISSGSFDTNVDFTTGTSPWGVALEDIDGDGKLDIAVTNYNSNTVSILRNTCTTGSISSSSFASPVDFTTGSNPNYVAFNDLDGDGKPDMVVTNFHSNTISVFRNSSTLGAITTGSFEAGVGFNTETYPTGLVIGDIDVDGKPDIVTTNETSNSISVIRNVCTAGSLTPASFESQVIFTASTYPTGIAIGDIDGDGKPDLAVTNYWSGINTVSVFWNNGTPGSIPSSTFSTRVDFTSGTNPNYVALNDLDGDGKPDMVVTNFGSGDNTISVYKNTSTAGSITASSFAAKVDFATGSGPNGVAIGDIDGDGRSDLALANNTGNSISILHNIVATPDLIAYYPFNYNANDESGNGNNGTENGGVALTTDRFGNNNLAYSFDGSDDYIHIPHSASLNFSGEITVSTWINPNQVDVAQQSITSKGGGWNRAGWLLTLNNNKVRWHLGDGTTEGIFDTDQSITANRWTHVVALWKDGTMNVYIDGVKDNYNASWASGLVANSQDLYIGKTDNVAFQFNGKIDDIKVYSKALTESEIFELYANYNPPQSFSVTPELGQNVLSWDPAGYEKLKKINIYRNATLIGEFYSPGSGNYTDCTVNSGETYSYYITSEDTLGNISMPSPAIEVTSQTFTPVSVTFKVNMSYQVAKGMFVPGTDFMDISGNFNNWVGSGAMTAIGDNIYSITIDNLALGKTYEYKFRKNASWDADSHEFPGGNNRWYVVRGGENMINHWYKDEAPTGTLTQPVADYRFNGNANDYSENHNHGIEYNGVTLTTERYGITDGAYSFDGTDDYIYSTSQPVPAGGNEYSVSLWFKANTLSKYQEMISQWTLANSGSSFYLGLTDAGYIRFSDGWDNITTGNITTGKWYHIVAISTADNAYIYINGILVATRGSALTYTGVGNLAIGTQGEYGINQGQEFFNGSLDDIRIYNRALSSAEIQNLFNNFYTAPVVTTTTPWIITETQANVGGQVTSDGGFDVTDFGIYYGTSPDPVTTGTKLSIGSGVSSYGTTLTSLSASTTYYVRAYATNAFGTAYGDELNFTTLNHTNFTEVSTNLIGLAYASGAWGDYDNDGDLDIVTMGYDETISTYATRLYRNDGSYVFTEMSEVGLPDCYEGSIHWGDYDGDFDLDLLITGINTSGSVISAIYRNDGGYFYDIGANLLALQYSSSSWGDYDNDGDLDIFLSGKDIDLATHSKIYRNDSGTFVDINATLEPLSGSFSASSAWGDYDNDGDLDLLYTGEYNSSTSITKVYRNDNGTFTDISASINGGVNGTVAWGDYDNDGDLDILVAGYYGSYIAKVYRNDSGTFTDIAAALTGIRYGSAVWGDYDNDGDLDILLTGQNGSIPVSIIYRNDEGTFNDISAGLIGVSQSWGIWGDADNDGDLDVVVSGYSLNDGLLAKFYRNDVATANTAPTTPANLQATVSGLNVTFTWDKATDTQTSQNGLSYNMYVIKDGQTSYLNPPHAFPYYYSANGLRLVAEAGEIQWSSAGYQLKNLPSGDYQWNVQAVDAGLKGSPFNTTNGSFTITSESAPVVTTDNVFWTTTNSVMANGTLVSDGGSAITARGFVWSTSQSPTVETHDGITTEEIGTGTFTSSITGLSESTTYYIRAYSTNAIGTSYGSEWTFTTITASSAYFSLIGDNICGTAWGCDIDFTYISTVGNVYTYKLYNQFIPEGTQFKVRTNHSWVPISFGYNEVTILGDPTNFVSSDPNIMAIDGKVYDITFTVDWTTSTYTLSFSTVSPTITTAAITSIHSQSAIGGGEVVSEGSNSVTAKGICWSTSANPTTSDYYTNDGSGAGAFSSTLSGLLPSTTYYVRAYAAISFGTFYGPEVSFTTDAISSVATVSSAAYIVDNDAGTITGVLTTETLSNFKNNLTPAYGATFEVYWSDGATVATDLQTGYLVIVTAEDGVTTKTYTITLTDCTEVICTIPSGSTSLCQGTAQTDYTTSSYQAISYVWEISPTSAGTISGDGTTGTVIWASSYYGTAQIRVRGINSTCTSTWTDYLNVSVNPLPTNVTISGLQSVCKDQNYAEYSTTPGADLSYAWAVDLGTIVSGQGTPKIMVSWGSYSGTGTVYLAHVNSVTGCYSTRTQNVTITNNIIPNVPEVRKKGRINILICTTPNLTYQWYLDGDVIANAAKQFYVARNNLGNYQVEITNYAGCKNRSSVYNVSTTSVLQTPLSIHPNPGNGNFTFNLECIPVGTTDVTIVDTYGAVVKRIQLEKNDFVLEEPIDLSDLMTGIYLVKAVVDGIVVDSQKLIIQ